VELTVTGPGGSNSTQSIVTVREPAPEAAFAFIASAPDTLEVSFVDQSSGAVTDWWRGTVADGATSTEQNPVHVYAAAGDYTVGLTVTGPGGSSSTQNVGRSAGAPRQRRRSFAAVSGLNGLRIAFTDQTTGAVTDWSWDFGDGESSSDQNPVHLYAARARTPCAWTATGPGGSSTAQDDLVVDDGTTGGGATGGGGGGGCGTVRRSRRTAGQRSGAGAELLPRRSPRSRCGAVEAPGAPRSISGLSRPESTRPSIRRDPESSRDPATAASRCDAVPPSPGALAGCRTLVPSRCRWR
jgi:PKD repeat protein